MTEGKYHYSIPSDSNPPPAPVLEGPIANSNIAGPSPPELTHGRQLRRRATEVPTKHKCHSCGERFKNITNYNRHKNSAKCSGQKRLHRYHCTYTGCNKSYSRKDNLDKHGRLKHSSPVSKGDASNQAVALESAAQFSPFETGIRFLDIDELEGDLFNGQSYSESSWASLLEDWGI
ncbi:hypothetical protein K440DRAFT_635430 [Wilcoxina mikolae CBS 423.85]|nr:hypothetical protein K440DRAFT_635430 [Wilcoxina mikolae CBS 423.85]